MTTSLSALGRPTHIALVTMMLFWALPAPAEAQVCRFGVYAQTVVETGGWCNCTGTLRGYIDCDGSVGPASSAVAAGTVASCTGDYVACANCAASCLNAYPYGGPMLFRACGSAGCCSVMGDPSNGVDDDCSGGPDDTGGGCHDVRTDPVHVGTGAFFTEPLTDVRFAGTHVPLEFVRTFSSQSGWRPALDDVNSVGTGWTHTFDQALIDTATMLPVATAPPTTPSWTARTVIYRLADGGGRAFACPAWTPTNWSCTTLDGSMDVLSWNASMNQLEIAHGDGLITRFHTPLDSLGGTAPSGRIAFHGDRAGDEWSVTYDTSTGRLISATDHLGRVLAFNWTADALSGVPTLTSLTAGATTPATFTYLDGGLYLGTASSVGGDDVYSYATGTNGGAPITRPFITTIVRGGRTLVTVAYDPTGASGLGTGRVASVTAADGDYTFRWSGAARNTCGGANRTEIVDRATSLAGGASCADTAAGDTFCEGLVAGDIAVCDAGVCRAATCQEYAAGAGAGSVRYNETISIDGNCPCGGADTFTWIATASGPRRMASRTTRDGTVTSYAYDSFGRLIAECRADTDATVTTTPSTCPVTGEWHAYTYHGTYGGLVATEQSRSRLSSNVITTTNAYDPTTALLTSVARQGYTYNSAGAVVLETQTTTYTRDYGNFGRVTAVTGPATSARTDFVYWPSGSGNSTGLLRYEREFYTVSAYMETTYSNHTTLGYAQTVATPHNSTRSFTYAFSGQRLTAFSEAGLSTTFSYDGNSNRVATVTEPSGRILRFTYSSAPVRLTDIDFLDAIGNTTFDTLSYTYDAAGRRLTSRLHRGATDTYVSDSTYDNIGHLASEGRGSLPNAVFTYDAAAMGYLESVTRGDGDVLDPGGYDAFGRSGVLTRNFGGGPTSLHARSFAPGAGNEVGDTTPWVVTDPGARSRTYVWDDFGHIVGATSNEWAGGMRYWFEQGRLREETRPNGARTVYTYDAAGRVTNIDNNAQTPSLLGPDYAFTYDDGAGSAGTCPTTSPTACAYRRSRLGRVRIEVTPGAYWYMYYDYAANGDTTYERYPDLRYTRYERDSVGRLSRLVYPTSSLDSIRYDYDATANNALDQTEVNSFLGERFSAGAWGGYITWGSVAGFTGYRDAAGRALFLLTHDTYLFNAHAFTYATHGRLASMRVRRRNGTGTPFDLVYRSPLTYSNDGELTGYDSLLAADPDRTFRYDGANRLLCATSVVGSASCPTASPLVESYVYDGSDNRTSSRRVAGLTTTTLNQNVVDFLTPPGRTVDYVNATATGGTRTIDQDTTAGVLANARTYSYDGMGRLSAMTLFRPSGTVGTMHAFTISIVYDHRSRPLYVSAMNNTTAVESRYQYYYDLEDRLLASITTPNVAVTSTYTTETYAHVSPLLVGTLRTNYVSSVGTEAYVYTANEENGLPIASYAFTRTGTITTTEVWRSASYPYGEHITPPGTVGPPPWRFAGQLVLPLSDARVWASGVNTLLRPALHLNRWRVYDPFLGRYLQPEPLALLGDEHYTNAFGYVGADPWNFVDPTGRKREGVLIGFCFGGGPAGALICAAVVLVVGAAIGVVPVDTDGDGLPDSLPARPRFPPIFRPTPCDSRDETETADPPVPAPDERERCRGVRNTCIAQCEHHLGIGDGGWRHTQCMAECMLENGCNSFPPRPAYP